MITCKYQPQLYPVQRDPNDKHQCVESQEQSTTMSCNHEMEMNYNN